MRPYFKIIVVFFLFCSPLFAQEIAVIKTRSITIVDKLVSGLQSVCQEQYPLALYDMQGDPHKGNQIITQVLNRLEHQQVKGIFTVGLPATRLVDKSLAQVPVLFSLIKSQEQHHLVEKNMSGISKDLPAQTIFQAIKKYLVNVQDVAIIHSNEISAEKIRHYQLAADLLAINLNLYPVESIKQVPKTLRRVITENEALILLRDKVVVNQSSLQYLLTTTLENSFPVLSYSQYLVKAGFLMGLSPDYSAMGRQAGGLLCNGQMTTATIYPPQKFEFSVNSKTARGMGHKLSPDLTQVADHVY